MTYEDITLVNGDCFDVMDELIQKQVKIDLLVTDPPYYIPKINEGGTVNNIKKLNKSLGDLKTVDITLGYDIKAFGERLLKLMDGVNAYFWCNKAQIPDYFAYYVGELGCKFDILCWHKTNALPTYSNKYLSDTEYLLYFRKGKGMCYPENYEDAKSYYIAPINHKDKKLYGHPTIKPLDITEKIIRNSSREGDLVLDTFMGSGTTMEACRNLKRRGIGIELEKTYFDIADKRINNQQIELLEEWN